MLYMKGHNIAVYLIIPLALFSIMSLFDNIQAKLTHHHLLTKRHHYNSQVKTQILLLSH